MDCVKCLELGGFHDCRSHAQCWNGKIWAPTRCSRCIQLVICALGEEKSRDHNKAWRIFTKHPYNLLYDRRVSEGIIFIKNCCLKFFFS